MFTTKEKNRREVYLRFRHMYHCIKWDEIKEGNILLLIDFVDSEIYRIIEMVAMTSPDFSKEGYPVQMIPIPAIREKYGGIEYIEKKDIENLVL